MDTSLLSQPGLFTHPGFIAGMAGGFIGMMGGLYGVFRSYRCAASSSAQRWIIMYAIAIFLICAGFVWAFLAAQATHRIYYQIGFFILLGTITAIPVVHLNRLHRRSDSQS
jgi:hypothetical protein